MTAVPLFLPTLVRFTTLGLQTRKNFSKNFSFGVDSVLRPVLCLYQQQEHGVAERRKTKGKTMDAYTALAEVEVDEAELTETVEVGDDFDAWMSDMLSGPADYDY